MTVVQYLNIYLTTPNAITRTLVFHLTICTSFHGILLHFPMHTFTYAQEAVYIQYIFSRLYRTRTRDRTVRNNFVEQTDR